MFDRNDHGNPAVMHTPILNVPRGGEAEVEVVGETPIYVAQHFVQRSLLCPGKESCQLCEMNHRIRPLFYVAVTCNKIGYLAALPASIPENHLAPGAMLFIQRARRNNRVTVQLSLFNKQPKILMTEDQLWVRVLRLYKISVDVDFNSGDSTQVRKVKELITKEIERASVRV